uniref:B30.2/SPRY domain-containing protein n=2 Tax=Magallana gigas TaxID=29159 RepID=A0A8W8N1S9_MAGGI|nr:SPRY domain-containing protein 3 [Crassostrea gigas]
MGARKVDPIRELVDMEMRFQNQMMNVWRRHRIRHAQEIFPVRPAEPGKPRFERVMVDGDIVSYLANPHNQVGIYIASDPLTPEDYYFEVEILDSGNFATIGVGLVPQRYPTDSQPGWRAFSVGYHADDGKLYKANGFGKPFGPKSQVGDRIGCGIKFPKPSADQENPAAQNMAKVFFTHNGKEVGIVMALLPPDGHLYPAVGMHSEGEEVKVILDAEWHYEDLELMAVDDGEDDWSRLYDVKLNGTMLEYSGRGKSIHDVGLAQARYALDTSNHYFEIEIVDPGENCYIAIGIARRNYPKNRHPGWNKGSVAYHADDGKIFVGSGVGEQFGPRCHKGDIMGCGILFPNDYDSEADSDQSPDDPDVSNRELDEYPSDSDSEDENMWWRQGNDEQGTKVQVFFTRNGKIVGTKQVSIPKGGFFPTVGMLSSCEKVRVDLHPLTG